MTVLLAAGTFISALFMIHAIINGVLLRRPHSARRVEESVAILVPCRNESANIDGLVSSIRNQELIDDLHILFLDDNSSDDTFSRLESARRLDPRITLLSGAELPSGWLGKPFACHQLASHTDADVLIFIDADVRLKPTAVASAIATMRSLDLALVSPYPRQIALTWSERLLQPLLQWSWLATLPLRWAERSTRTSLSAANGQFLVVDGTAYRQAGGHAAISGQVLDDIRILQHLKRAGHRGVVIDGSSLATCRMYTSWNELRDGYSKWLWSAFGSPIASVIVAVLLAIAYILPTLAMATGSWLGLLGYLTAVVSRMVAAVRSGDRLILALFHPVSIALLILLMALSWLGHQRGSLSWKERVLS
jgi:hypothetical protein